MVLRTAVVQDISRLNELVNSVYRGENAQKGWTTEAALLDGQRVDDQMLADIISNVRERIFLFEDSGQILGCVHSVDKEKNVFLGMLSVPVELQGRGLGKKLMNIVEKDAKARGFAAVQMHVLSVRQELLDWYYRHGYKNTGEKSLWPYGDKKWGIPKRDDLEFLVLSKNL